MVNVDKNTHKSEHFDCKLRLAFTIEYRSIIERNAQCTQTKEKKELIVWECTNDFYMRIRNLDSCEFARGARLVDTVVPLIVGVDGKRTVCCMYAAHIIRTRPKQASVIYTDANIKLASLYNIWCRGKGLIGILLLLQAT